MDNIKSEVNFVGLYIQAFGLNKGTPSTSESVCVCVCVCVRNVCVRLV